MAAVKSIPGVPLQIYNSGQRKLARAACLQMVYDAPKVNQMDTQTNKPDASSNALSEFV
jgi:hypothetical protein